MPRPARVAALTAAVVVGLACLAAPAASAKPDTTVTLTILPAQLRLVPGESATLRLSTNITTGYSWSYAVTRDRSAVTVVQKQPAPPAAGALIGAPTTTDWVVTARSVGTALVTIRTTPPGGGTATKVGTLRVIVMR